MHLQRDAPKRVSSNLFFFLSLFWGEMLTSCSIDKTSQQMLDRVGAMEATIEEHIKELKDHFLEMHENMLKGFKMDLSVTKLKREHAAKPVSAVPQDPQLDGNDMSPDQQPDITDKGDASGPIELSIPWEHTTAAHKLLRWP